jgi:UDP-glucose 4-epimerase
MTAARRVLITGIAGRLAGALAARLEADDRVDYLAGVDLREPTVPLGRTEFVRADLRNPLVARVVESTRVDTVVHLSVTAAPGSVGGRSRMKEHNVIGTMQLLAGAQKAPRVQRVIVKSTTAVYGSSSADPALFREDVEPGGARSGYSKDAVEVEGYARAFGRRRPDVSLTILRFANFIGADVHSPLTTYFELPVAPQVMGFDPRVQLVHTEDAVSVLAAATLDEHPGIYNVAGPGILYLSQAVRLAGRPTVPVPAPAVELLTTLLGLRGGIDITHDQLSFLLYGRVADITRLRERFGYEPKYSTRDAFLDFLDARGVRPLVEPATAARWERDLGHALTRVLHGVDRAVARAGAGTHNRRQAGEDR